MNILRIDSSPRGERSHSRALTAAFTDALTKKSPGASVTYRDLGHNPPAHVNEQWIAGTYSDPATHTPEMTAALLESEEMIGELMAADVIVIGAPMYNFSIPSTLKAYIDQVVRPGRTFKYPEYEGLVNNKKMFILCARGGGDYGAGEQMESANFQDPYFKQIFGMIGISDIEFLYDEKTLSGEDNLSESLNEARELAGSVA